jgi:hypothetical protein
MMKDQPTIKQVQGLILSKLEAAEQTSIGILTFEVL